MPTMPPQEAFSFWLWAEPPMPGVAVSGRAAKASPAKEVRSIAPETKGDRGVPEHAVTRANRFGEDGRCGSWYHGLARREHADEDQPPLDSADRSTAR